MIEKRYIELYDIVIKISNFENNWDGYGAYKISENAIIEAFFLLNYWDSESMFNDNVIINVFPMRDGGIQFEIDNVLSNIDLEIENDGNSKLISYDLSGNRISEIKNITLKKLKEELLKLN